MAYLRPSPPPSANFAFAFSSTEKSRKHTLSIYPRHDDKLPCLVRVSILGRRWHVDQHLCVRVLPGVGAPWYHHPFLFSCLLLFYILKFSGWLNGFEVECSLSEVWSIQPNFYRSHYLTQTFWTIRHSAEIKLSTLRHLDFAEILSFNLGEYSNLSPLFIIAPKRNQQSSLIPVIHLARFRFLSTMAVC